MKFRDGDLIEIIDKKERRFILKLKKGEKFHFHYGFINHDDLIGKHFGSKIKTSKGFEVIAFPVKKSSFVLHMKRGAQIIYPKDIGAILIYGDIHSGLKIFEAGGGSGALSIYLLSILGKRGKLITYEIREDFLKILENNVKTFFTGLPKNFILRKRDIYNEGLHEDDKNFDRAILDLPEPWNAIKNVDKGLKRGGILISYNPTIQQIIKFKSALQEMKNYYFEGMYEILERRWKIEENAVRPMDRMVAHTGFIIVARKV
ncbi:MAG: tRNA (adenine-N1)-methyltransferase [Caldisericia bacterium]|nr:tRNA (adenine-N1)-methyltransferase [Caldisericia bacterium]